MRKEKKSLFLLRDFRLILPLMIKKDFFGGGGLNKLLIS